MVRQYRSFGIDMFHPALLCSRAVLVCVLAGLTVARAHQVDCGGLDPDQLVDCQTELLLGQYLCTELDVDPATQQLRGCRDTAGIVLFLVLITYN